MKKIKGVILSRNAKYIILLTPDGEYIKVPARNRIYKPGTEIEIELPSAGNVKKFALVASVFFILCFALIFNIFTTSTEAYLALDINPSILLSLDREAAVIKAEALNVEGEKILKNLELKKRNALEAVKLILENARHNNYLAKENNEIFISLAAPDNYVISEKEIKSCVFEKVWEMEIDSYLKISRAEVQQAVEAKKRHISLNSMLIHSELTAKGIFKEDTKQPQTTLPASVKEITRGVDKEKIFNKDDFIPGNRASKPDNTPPLLNKENSKATEKGNVFIEEIKEEEKEEKNENEKKENEKTPVDNKKEEQKGKEKEDIDKDKNKEKETREEIIPGKEGNKGKENVSGKPETPGKEKAGKNSKKITGAS